MSTIKTDLRKKPTFVQKTINGAIGTGELPFTPGTKFDESNIPQHPGTNEQIEALLNDVPVISAQNLSAVKNSVEIKQPEVASEKKEEVKPKEDKKENLLPITCSHCGWPVDDRDKTDPTETDKNVFVAATLGQQRFVKTYQLLGGKFTVTFRSLTTNESDLVIKQLVKDWNDAKISGPSQSVAEALRYQMNLALAQIESETGLTTLPTLDEYTFDEPEKGATILVEFNTNLQNTVLKNEPTRRIIAKAYGHFIDTLSKLEAMAETPDFYQASEV
jgi:hypothetical protein